MPGASLRHHELRPLLALLLLAGCGGGDTDAQPGSRTAEVAPAGLRPPSTAVSPAGLDEGTPGLPAPESEYDADERRQVANGRAMLAEVDRRIAGADGYRRTLSAGELRDYDLYKAVARDLYRQDMLELNSHIDSEGSRSDEGRVIRAPAFDLAQCASLNILDQERMDERQSSLQRQAAEFVQLEQDLARAGYDPASYTPALARLEQRKLQMLSDELAHAAYIERMNQGDDQDSRAPERAFADEVEPVRKARQPDRLPIVIEGGCGDGETEFPFEIRPADGVAQIIRVFSFDVCDKRRLDPWNTDRCRNWVSVRDGGSLPVSGSYRVQVKWPDGRSYRGDFTTQAFSDEGDAKPIRFTAPAAPGAGGRL